MHDELTSPAPAVRPPAARPTVVIVICCYNSLPYLPDCLGSLAACNTDALDVHIVAVDNASPDASAAWLREHHPQVHLLNLEKNLGFTGGNNAGWQYTLTHFPQVDYLVLLNHDTIVEKNWLQPLVAHLKQHAGVAAVQPKLLLHPQVDRINTAGNVCHFLGFGYMTGFNEPDDGRYDDSREIGFASGAAVMIRAGVLHHTGLFDETFFAYLEDADLAWRCRLAGQTMAYVPASRVQHKYVVKAPLGSYFLLERNRWVMLLTCYKWRTLLLLAPALLFMEAGQWFFALVKGVLTQRLRVMGWFLRPSSWRHLRTRRAHLQRMRMHGDAFLTANMQGQIHFEAVDHPLLRYVANPILGAYWRMARRLIIW